MLLRLLRLVVLVFALCLWVTSRGVHSIWCIACYCCDCYDQSCWLSLVVVYFCVEVTPFGVLLVVVVTITMGRAGFW